VTDTKSFAYSDKDKAKQFEYLVNAAAKMDELLLKRIVPQVYDQSCYEIMMDIYPFDSVIYTLYESPDTDEEVVAFVAKHDNIKVVTMEWYRYTEEFYDNLTKLSKYIYFFTLNVPKEIEKCRSWGIHGFYTDYVNPK
jgi:glycerophosphoryl diester phosphodiesterase